MIQSTLDKFSLNLDDFTLKMMPNEFVGGLQSEKFKHNSTISRKVFKYWLTISILYVKILVQFESYKRLEGRLKM